MAEITQSIRAAATKEFQVRYLYNQSAKEELANADDDHLRKIALKMTKATTLTWNSPLRKIGLVALLFTGIGTIPAAIALVKSYRNYQHAVDRMLTQYKVMKDLSIAALDIDHREASGASGVTKSDTEWGKLREQYLSAKKSVIQ